MSDDGHLRMTITELLDYDECYMLILGRKLPQRQPPPLVSVQDNLTLWNLFQDFFTPLSVIKDWRFLIMRVAS